MEQALTKEKCTGSFSFIFSAEWDHVTKKKRNQYIRDRYSISLSQRLDLIEAVKMLLSKHWVPYHCVEDITARSEKWDNQKGFTADDDAVWLYREFMYFSGKVRPLVYNTCEYSTEEQFLKKIRLRKPACVILERNLLDKKVYPNRYLLLRKKGEKLILYSLPVTSIQLRLYASGVLNLSICCNDEINASDNLIQKKEGVSPKDTLSCPNETQGSETTVDDIAWIRNAGRRLFWPFGCGDSSVEFHPESDAPVYSALQIADEPIVLCDYRTLYGWTEDRVTKPEYFEWTRRLLCDNCVTFMKLKSDPENIPKEDMLVIQYFNDDRMYLHNTIVSPAVDELVKEGWIHRKELTNPKVYPAAEKKDKPTETSRTGDEKDDSTEKTWKGMRAWYAILAADTDWLNASCEDVDMLIQKCEEATDARWLNYGTFYGLYYNAMTQLVSSDSGFLSRNMDWMYYQMFLLAIMQRSSMQRFYREASGAAVHRANHKAGVLSDALKSKYVFFMNSMWFTEVTEQEQGCDFFDKLRENMGLSQDMELLKNAIAELNAVTEKNLEDAVKNALLPATFIGLGLTAVGALNALFQKPDAGATDIANQVDVNAFVTPFPWALVGVSGSIVAAAMIYYWLRKR